MRRHRLDDADIRTLAAGTLCAELVRRLRSAEVSRHLILLEAVRRKIVAGANPLEHSAVDVGGFEQALAALIRLERTSPVLVRSVLCLPQLGAWACQCLAASASGRPADLGYLASLVASAKHGTGDLSEAVRLRISCRDITLNVVLDHTDPCLDLYGPRVDSLSGAELTAWRHRLTGALRLIARHDRCLAAAIATGLTTIVPLQMASDGRPRSATSGWAFGAVALSLPPDDRWCADSLVHEFRHLVLSAVTDHFPLLRPAGGPLGYAPWREDPRPPSGLLFGAHAYLGLLAFWRCQDERAAGEMFTRWLGPTAEVVESLAASDALTREGSLVVTAMREKLSDLQAGHRPSAAYRLAEDAAADHRLRWRLRHLRPDDRALDALADAWSAGDRPVTVSARLVPGMVREPAPTTRSRMLEPAREPFPCSPLDRATQAVLDGRYDAAAMEYKARIAAKPDADAWTGLSLCRSRSHPQSALVRRPELVAGLHARLRTRPDGPADPDRLGAWLGDDQVIIGSMSSGTLPR
jgi:hypothetical protein